MTPLLLTLLLLGLSTVTTAAPPDLLGGQEAAAAFAAAAAASPSAAAAATGSTDPSLITDWQQAFLRDRDLKYSVSANKLLYACSGLIHDHDDVAEGTTVDATADNAFFNSTLNAPSIPGDPSSFAFPNEFDPATTDAFKLHSRPTSTKKIVLDFTGHTLRAGTSWSNLNNFGSTAAIITPPWSLDSDPAFSATELRAIVSIWRNVAEDYSNWDVDVTTEEPPGTDDQADASLVGVGTRVAIGQNNGWFDPSGGVAFVNGFGKSSTGPVAYVFNPSPLGVARAVSHEVGHTVGLGHHGTVAHDGLPAEEYYEGHNEWGPIMGAGYYVNVVQWSKGDYPYANNPSQDDIGIISTKLTRPAFLGGGASNSAATALTPPTDSAPITSVVGLMSASTELHVYKFRTSGAGAVTLKLSVTPPGTYGPRTHLAAKVRVLRADTGAVVGVPFDNVGSSGIDGNIADTPATSFNIPSAGLYYVELSSTNNGAFATYGYSSYGSSGTYMIALGAPSGLVVNADSPPPPPPNVLTCKGTTTLQLSSTANNCATGVAVRAVDLYTTTNGQVATTVSPAVGTVLAGGATQLFTITLGAESCTTTVNVLACPEAIPDRIACNTKTYTLGAGKCGSTLVPEADLYVLSAGVGAPAGSRATGTAITSLPVGGSLGPGVHRIDVVATNGGATCTAVVTVNPCRPVVVSTTTAVKIVNQPNTCAALLAPSAVVSAATLGQGALSINARTSATGSIIPQPLKAGKYYVQVVYPGGLKSAISAGSVPVVIQDVDPPLAAIKSSIVRDSTGFICARGTSSTATRACLSTSTSTTGVITLKDNCAVSLLTRKYACSGTYCPTTLPTSTATKVCVPVVRGGARREVVYTMTVTDKGGKQGQVQIPIAAYHYSNKPAGVTCYYA